MNLSRSDGLILITLALIALPVIWVASFTARSVHSHEALVQASGAPEIIVIDLNRASYGELTSLPGIGPALAKRILSRRMLKGPFMATAELKEIKGIGPVTFERISSRVEVCGSTRC